MLAAIGAEEEMTEQTDARRTLHETVCEDSSEDRVDEDLPWLEAVEPVSDGEL